MTAAFFFCYPVILVLASAPNLCIMIDRALQEPTKRKLERWQTIFTVLLFAPLSIAGLVTGIVAMGTSDHARTEHGVSHPSSNTSKSEANPHLFLDHRLHNNQPSRDFSPTLPLPKETQLPPRSHLLHVPSPQILQRPRFSRLSSHPAHLGLRPPRWHRRLWHHDDLRHKHALFFAPLLSGHDCFVCMELRYGNDDGAVASRAEGSGRESQG